MLEARPLTAGRLVGRTRGESHELQPGNQLAPGPRPVMQVAAPEARSYGTTSSTVLWAAPLRRPVWGSSRNR